MDTARASQGVHKSVVVVPDEGLAWSVVTGKIV